MRAAVLTSALLLAAAPALAQDMPAGFHAGKEIAEYGPVASIDYDLEIPKNFDFKIQFDAKEGADAGALNKQLVSAARFINMSVENGVKMKNIHLAIVVHGGATLDLLGNDAYKTLKKTDADNANAGLVAALLDKGVRIYICGQSAVAHGAGKEDFLPGVQMALSAMTAHAILSGEGYAADMR